MLCCCQEALKHLNRRLQLVMQRLLKKKKKNIKASSSRKTSTTESTTEDTYVSRSPKILDFSDSCRSIKSEEEIDTWCESDAELTLALLYLMKVKAESVYIIELMILHFILLLFRCNIYLSKEFDRTSY
jgi:hypothetical protein